MTEEIKKAKKQKMKKEKTDEKAEEKKIKEVKTEKQMENKTDTKIEDKKEIKKAEVKRIVKEVAVVNGFSLQISTKHSASICKMIKGKSPEEAIKLMEKILIKKIAVPMRGMEIPHRKRGLMPTNAGGGGRFPRNAAREFINLLKQLKANCDVNGIDNPIITLAISNLGSRPFKREGRRAKRTHVYLEARDKTKLITGKKR